MLCLLKKYYWLKSIQMKIKIVVIIFSSNSELEFGIFLI